MKNIAERFISLVLAAAILAPITVYADSNDTVTGDGYDKVDYESKKEICYVSSGICGDKLSWVLDEDGTLTISGIGEMSMVPDVAPRDVRAVVICDGVTSICDYAFYKCFNLTSVVIADSVTTIGDAAFYMCVDLTSVTIPDNVTTVGGIAFYGCSKLMNLIIGGGVTSIGDSAFQGCNSLTSVIIPDSMTTISYCAFQGCQKLTNITIPDSVTSIGSHAFFECGNLKSVTIPDSVTSIGDYAFRDCSNLTNVYFCGNAPRIYSALSVARSFPSTATLFYEPGTIGWTDSTAYDAEAGTWNGYRLMARTPLTCTVTVLDASTGDPIPGVTLAALTKENVVTESSYDGLMVITETSELFISDCLLIFYADGYKDFMCFMSDLDVDDEHTRNNIIFLTPNNGESIGVETESFIKNHCHYIESEDYAKQRRMGFYNNVWNLEEQTNSWQEAFYGAYNAVDFLSKVVSIDIPGLVEEFTAEADFYETFICDLAITVSNSVATEYSSALFTKELAKINGSVLDLFDVYVRGDEFAFKLASLETEYPYIKDLAVNDIKNKVTDYFLGRVEDDEFVPAANAIFEDFWLENQAFVSAIYNNAQIGKTILNYVNDGAKIIDSIREANYAYSAMQCVKGLENEMSTIIFEACAELSSSDNGVVDADKMKKAYERLIKKAEVDEDSLLKECLAGSILEIGYSRFVKSSLEKIVQVGVLRLLDETLSYDVALILVDNANLATTIFDVGFSLTDMIIKGNERIDAYFQMKQIAQFEKALANVVEKKAAAVLTNQDFLSVSEFETVFKYWAATNVYLYKAAYEFNAKYVSRFSIGYSDEKKAEALKDMTDSENYWRCYKCHNRTIINRYKYTSIQCPVDVYVYDRDNNIIVAIVNEEITHCDETITALVSNGMKSLMYPAIADYKIKIVAREDGTMDYHVAEIDDGGTQRNISFYDIPLTAEKVFTGTIPSEFGIHSDKYSLFSDGKEIKCNYDSAEPVPSERSMNPSIIFLLLHLKAQTHIITATASEGGSITPNGDVEVGHGDDVTYTITPNDGYHVASILVDGEPAEIADTYMFEKVKEDHEIIVTFQKKE